MNGLERDDIIRMAANSGMELYGFGKDREKFLYYLERFVALVAAAEREKVAQWMMQRGYATGHGDTIEDLLAELDWQIADGWSRALMNGVKTEREACANVADEHMDGTPEWNSAANNIASAIRARGNNAA